MSDLKTLARPYAKAIIELAQTAAEMQTWSDSLQLSASIAGDSQMQRMFDSPALSAAERADLFLEVFADVKEAPKVNEALENLIKLLSTNDRLACIPALALEFESLKQAAEGRVEVEVRSALELTDQQRGEIAKRLTKKLGKEVNIRTEVDASLLAGAIIRVGDRVIDGSTRDRFDKLATMLQK